ncbi:PREDICTED: serine-arginine protein 55-like [Priapulus caudatus]|uniref:Serine-arginine protein 55-like n=1 Tax=Priapulus caudatus TaxID=37621 RepID=A0ABM1ES12_PRICU|nr:PREDICTED: serine-arginine protein 55-like [Priapulus caudatus]
MQHEKKKECEIYDHTTTAELSSSEEECGTDPLRKRKMKKKLYPGYQMGDVSFSEDIEKTKQVSDGKVLEEEVSLPCVPTKVNAAPEQIRGESKRIEDRSSVGVSRETAPIGRCSSGSRDWSKSRSVDRYTLRGSSGHQDRSKSRSVEDRFPVLSSGWRDMSKSRSIGRDRVHSGGSGRRDRSKSRSIGKDRVHSGGSVRRDRSKSRSIGRDIVHSGRSGRRDRSKSRSIGRDS